MLKIMPRKLIKAGLPPGTPIFTGERKIEKVKISLIDYDEVQFQEKEVRKTDECFPFKETPTVTWINIDGIHDVEVVKKIGNHFGLHPLILEDIVNTQQRPKIEDFGHYIFIILKMLFYDEDMNETHVEQVSLVLGSNFVISFQEREGDIFNPIRERIRSAKGRIRKMGADYLAYSLMDAVVDEYFIILERIGAMITEMEDELMSGPKPETMHKIHTLRNEMIFLRKSVWPLRELIGSLEKGESSLIQESTGIFLRDLYDHTIQVIDTVETLRNMLSGMHETYLSVVSNKMNEIMKVLTMIATVFIPLTFIAGIYGMNFKFMPELEWRWSYFIVWFVLIIIVGFMFMFFKRKKWL